MSHPVAPAILVTRRDISAMSTPPIPAFDAVNQVLVDTAGLPAFLAGSAAAAIEYDKPFAYHDVDVFVPNPGMYFAVVQRLLDNGYEIESDRFVKMWRRHMNYGFNRWHTNSMKLKHTLSDIEVNVIYKLVDGHETTRLSQVLESFDFGLLGVGYETETGRRHDMRTYFFGPGADDGRALPLLPYRKEGISQGFMSQHIMLRTPGRYARYAHTYGYDLHLVKPTLVDGLSAYAEYKSNRSKPEDLVLGDIARRLAKHIEDDQFTELLEFEKALPTADGVDQILESLE